MPYTTIDEALENQFALRRRHPERGAVYDDYRQRSAAFRALAPVRLDVRYGTGPRCCLDVFPAAPDAPVFLFIHGGYWRALDRTDFSFLAAPYQQAGLTVVMPSYDLAPAVRVGDILAQMRDALAWVIRTLKPPRLLVGGHSAGGHLAAMLALEEAERPQERSISGVVGVSGAFDLVPLLQTSVNDDVHLTRSEAERLSPLRRLAALPKGASLAPLLAIVGGAETDGFKAWSRDLHAAWIDHGAESALMEPPGYTHFTILDPLSDPQSQMTRSILAMA